MHFQDGPIDLIVEALGAEGEVRAAYRAAAARFAGVLDELCGELPLLRSPVAADSREPEGEVARRMFRAVWPFAAEALPLGNI